MTYARFGAAVIGVYAALGAVCALLLGEVTIAGVFGLGLFLCCVILGETWEDAQ